jgi:hypothetical protein
MAYRRICSSARFDSGGVVASVVAPGSVDSAGAELVVAPPQAARTMAMVAKMPRSRFCINCPPKRV